MFKILLPLLSFLMGSYQNFVKEPAIGLTQNVVLHIRSIGLILVSALGSLVLFCVGFSLLIHKIATQMDTEVEFNFSIGMWIYLGLTLVSALGLFISFKTNTWLKAMGFNKAPEPKKETGAIENAIALLIMDFVEARQEQRKDDNSKKND